jgi:hypothetical protein
MPKSRTPITLCALLISACLLTPQPGHAQARLLLEERAQQPIAGPATMLGIGLTLIVAAPLVSIGLAMASLRDSGGLFCEQDCGQSSSGSLDGAAIGSGIVLTAAGAALTAYGMTRVIQIRSARRRLTRLEGVGVGVTPQSAQLGIRLRF